MRPVRCWADGDVEVWRIDVSQALPERSLLQMSDDELARAARLVHASDRRRYLASRHALRRLLAGVIGLRAEEVAYGRGPHGKPFVLGHTHCHFSFSHRGDVALVALSATREVGVDLEPVDSLPDLETVAGAVCSASERAQWARCPLADRGAAFVTCWTRKEAGLKATGVGLSVDPACIDVGIDGVKRQTKIPTPTSDLLVHISSFSVEAGRIAAVAAVLQ